LNEHASSENFWNNNEAAQSVLKERARLEEIVKGFDKLVRDIADLDDLVDLAAEEQDSSRQD
jgi:hypothetical protein